jgi:hypothetical protein
MIQTQFAREKTQPPYPTNIQLNQLYKHLQKAVAEKTSFYRIIMTANNNKLIGPGGYCIMRENAS